MSLLPVPLPEFNRKVKAAIRVAKNDGSWAVLTDYLVAVDEDDCSWRFHECLTELAFHADVIYWEYVPEDKEI